MSDARAADPPDEPRFMARLRERYFRLDRRALGLFRIYLGGLLFVDCVRRIPYAAIFYSNDGVLSNHFALFAPLAKPSFSLYFAFSTPGEITVALALTATIYLFYAAGLYTRAAQIAAVILYPSLHQRNLLTSNGGSIVLAILVVWAALLPLGDRFSVDALLRSLRARRDRTVAGLDDRRGMTPLANDHLSIVGLALALEIFAIYFFNVIHKTGETWSRGESVHWVLWQNRIATGLAAWLRMHEPAWLSPILSKAALVMEATLAACAISPVFQRVTRALLLALACVLHLSFAATLTLGPFSYAMIGLTMTLFPGAVLDRAAAWLRVRRAARIVVYDGGDAALHWVGRILSRLDRFERLTFVDARAAGAPSGRPDAPFAVLHDGRWSVGAAAIVDAARSLPMGPLWVALLSNPLGRALLGAAFRGRARLALARGWRAAAPPEAAEPYALADDPSPAVVWWHGTLESLREGFAGLLLLVAILQISEDNHGLPSALHGHLPASLRPLVAYAGISRGWSMFSPDAPRQDGKLVIDAVTVGGRHVDPLDGGRAPDFEAPLHGPWYQSQLECDWQLKYSFDRNEPYRQELRRYLARWHELTGRPPADRIVAFEVHWVGNDAPPPGSTTPTGITKHLLLSSR